LGIMMQGGQKSILRRTAHIHAGDDVDDFDLLVHF
jgi:hypothetical protein